MSYILPHTYANIIIIALCISLETFCGIIMLILFKKYLLCKKNVWNRTFFYLVLNKQVLPGLLILPRLCIHTHVYVYAYHTTKLTCGTQTYTAATWRMFSLISIHLLHLSWTDPVSLTCAVPWASLHTTGLCTALRIHGGNELIPSSPYSCVKPGTTGLWFIWGPWVWLPYKYWLITTDHQRLRRCTGCKEKSTLLHNKDILRPVACTNIAEMAGLDENLSGTSSISIWLFRQW